MYLRLAVEDERLRRGEIREVIEFAVRFFSGASEEPTAERPVVETHARSGQTDISVKKVLDSRHEERMKALAEESMRLKREEGDLIGKVLEQAKADLAKKKEGTNA